MILYRYILRNHAGPFIFSVLTLIFIFLFNFLTKFAERLVGKGLDTFVIIKLVAYNLAWMVVLVVPMSVLVATLMAYGNMSNNNEIAIMKASGISVYKMIIAPFIVSIILGVLLVQFNNEVYPDANHAARLLIQDISNKKPTLSLVPGVFSQEVPNYAIHVRGIDENSNTLKGVTIYDYSTPEKLNVVTAKSGRIYFSQDQSKLIMDLTSGEIHESEQIGGKLYRKLIFEKHRIIMNAEQFSFQQSTPGGPRGDRELGAPEMMTIVDSLKAIRAQLTTRLNKDIKELILKDLEVSKRTGPKSIAPAPGGPVYERISPSGTLPFPSTAEQMAMARERGAGNPIYERVKERISVARNVILSDMGSLQLNKETINSFMVEVHKKYSLPAACIVFVLIGAPLGIMTRKGGIGVAAGISVVFFLIYWAFLIGGEKFADRGLLSPFWGMWSANFLLAILGVFLTVKSAKETITINFSWLQKLIPQQWRSAQEEEDETNR